MFLKRNIIQFIKNKLYTYTYSRNGSVVKFNGSNIKIEKGSKFVIGDNVKIINSTIHLSGNSVLVLGDNSLISDSIISLNNSECHLKKGVILKTSENKKTKLYSDHSKIEIESYVRLTGTSVYCRFESILEIDEYSGFSGGTEIFCHEHIKIGKFVLIAEDVCIYDTNTHSVDAIKRRDEIVVSYPLGLWDKLKPISAPVLIGDNVWLGKGSAVLKGTELGNNCIVGFGTIVGGGKYPESSIVVSSHNRVLIKDKTNEI